MKAADTLRAKTALAALNRPQDVTWTSPLKLSVILLALADKSSACDPYRADLAAMQSQVAKQLSGSSGGI